jgi:uncharacterized phage infection (PIP) family protein YhgE
MSGMTSILIVVLVILVWNAINAVWNGRENPVRITVSVGNHEKGNTFAETGSTKALVILVKSNTPCV